MNGKDKITKMNNMEIKVGDTVRVSKDIPQCYVGWIPGICEEYESIVTSIGEQYAEIRLREALLPEYHSVPAKYLVKVDAEAKEAKFKVGDRVRNIESGLIGVVDKIVYGNIAWVNGVDGKRYHWKSDELELIKPTEQTHQRATIISEGDIHSLDETSTNKIGSIKIPVEVDLTDSYWNAYAANLAREVALKVANKYNGPEQAAGYAVKVAKAVVEGLKRK